MENPVCAESSEPSTARIAVCADCVGTHQRHLFPFVLSLSKYERTRWPFQSLPFDKLPSTSSERSRANGLENMLLSPFL
ncbi:MAG: hypothetical protein LBD67_00755 [Candidatus Accumulibacter sp.]|nr:hypothetical protein [Accumulibacter sp.]